MRSLIATDNSLCKACASNAENLSELPGSGDLKRPKGFIVAYGACSPLDRVVLLRFRTNHLVLSLIMMSMLSRLLHVYALVLTSTPVGTSTIAPVLSMRGFDSGNED